MAATDPVRATASGARVLVIGRGVFGSLAAEELRRRGHDASTTSRSAGTDARDEASVARALAGFDAVLHAAGPFQEQPPSVARAAAALGVPYADLSDDAAFCARVAALASETPVLTGMSTTPALAEALAAFVRARGAGEVRCTMWSGGANRAGPATFAFAAQARAPGRAVVVDIPRVGRRRAYPARAAYDGPFYVALGGLAGLGWRLRPLARLGPLLGPRAPRVGSDTSGALLAESEAAREALVARYDGQRLAVLPAVWALEEALAGRAPPRAALPRAWVRPEALARFVEEQGFERVST